MKKLVVILLCLALAAPALATLHAKHSGAITWLTNVIAAREAMMLALNPEDSQYCNDLQRFAEDIAAGRDILEWLEDPDMSDEYEWWEARKTRSYLRILNDEARCFALADVSIVTPPQGP
jgi:hypothetical protein